MTVAANNNLEIARVIMAQLGGGRFSVMTGAKMFVAIENGVQFRIGRFTGVKTNMVRVVLNGRDLYDVEFLQVRGVNCKVIKLVEDVYAEDLQRVFTDATGLDTHL